ncbi:MAG: hypothetical protein RBS56_01110 [Candidatus Gracilibacteria bacterium]|jgi:hypothetical protein|nr:hypothetical protein [Candidatus Gracilibacteria bacterium]
MNNYQLFSSRLLFMRGNEKAISSAMSDSKLLGDLRRPDDNEVDKGEARTEEEQKQIEKEVSDRMEKEIQKRADDIASQLTIAPEENGFKSPVDQILGQTPFKEGEFEQTTADFERANEVYASKTVQNFLIDLVNNVENPDGLGNIISQYGDRRLGGRITMGDFEISADNLNTKLFRALGKQKENLFRDLTNPNYMILKVDEDVYKVPVQEFFTYSNNGRSLKALLKKIKKVYPKLDSEELFNAIGEKAQESDVKGGFYVEDRPESEDFTKPEGKNPSSGPVRSEKESEKTDKNYQELINKNRGDVYSADNL